MARSRIPHLQDRWNQPEIRDAKCHIHLLCLGSLKNLRKFNYDDSSLWDGDDALDRSGVEMACKALLKHAKTSLEYLCRTEDWHPAESSDSTPNPISLKPFKKLTQASLSCHL